MSLSVRPNITALIVSGRVRSRPRRPSTRGPCTPSPTALSTPHSSGRTASAWSAGSRRPIRRSPRSSGRSSGRPGGPSCSPITRRSARTTCHGSPELDEIDTLITDSGLDGQLAERPAVARPERAPRMIVTLTLNPSVDRTVEVESLARGEVMRAQGGRVDPGQGDQRVPGTRRSRPADTRGGDGRWGRGRTSRRPICGTRHRDRAGPDSSGHRVQHHRRRAGRDHDQVQRARRGVERG